ncbi:Gfo/Idh/MocA family oxidoreductase [Pirellulales bacterium]|nr:Gfo/Idh/MocA family oxidoreductase [Pirellulales bacterium]
MQSLRRRTFLSGTAAAAGAAALSPWARAAGANDAVRMAVVGFRWRGEQLIDAFRKVPGVRIGALCDVDQQLLDSQVEKFKERGEPVVAYTDVRKLLDDKNIDAVAIATPNHWHALMSIWACQAGKDVYVEKPVSHNIWEGGQLVAAARRYDRIVQTGTQNRSDVGLVKAMQYLHDGKLGPLKVVRGLCYNRRASIGKVDGPQTVPAHVNYDLWSGPAPIKPLLRKQFHYDWHWDYTYGSGDLGNQGVHEMDLCRWALGADKLPPRVVSVAGRLGYDDDGNTANTQIALLDYDPVPILFEVRGLPAQTGQEKEKMDRYRNVSVGIVVECEQGYFAGGRGGGKVYDYEGNVLENFPGDSGGDHQANFIAAVRSRDARRLRADVQEGHLSSALCHMANLSYQLGKPASSDEISDALTSDGLAADGLDRMLAHLSANQVDLNKTPLTLGANLAWDDSTQQFAGSDQANRMLTREYRTPYRVPEVV